MFTKETICKEIKSLVEGPMTAESTEVLAFLTYIKEHCRELPDASHDAGGMGSNGLSRDAAIDWVKHMQNADGTTGPHWTMDKTEEVRVQRGIDCGSLAFWAAMNMMYSDYVMVAERVGANSVEFYACMAKAFLEDKDVQHRGMDKLARYYEYVVK